MWANDYTLKKLKNCHCSNCDKLHLNLSAKAQHALDCDTLVNVYELEEDITADDYSFPREYTYSYIIAIDGMVDLDRVYTAEEVNSFLESTDDELSKLDDNDL